MNRTLAMLVTLGTLLVACGSSEGATLPDPQAGATTPAVNSPARESPSVVGETPDQRFESWLETGGGAEIYEAWVSGQLPGDGPSSDASDEELQALFEKWMEGHLRLVRGAWNRAQDKGAQAALRNSLAAALVYAVDHASFAGFTPSEAHSIEPSLTFNIGKTVFGEVSIRTASATAVLLTTESASGEVFCAVHLLEDLGTSFGAVDAKTVSSCAGGWPE